MIRPRRHSTRFAGQGGPVQAALAWLAHPVTVAATGLLLVNDHLLKAAYPGWVTGKLSDLAGLVMAPPVVALLLALVRPRLRPQWHATGAVVLVGVLFTAVKASPAVAAYASGAWSLVRGTSVVLADRTDLLALPALGVAYWAGRASARWLPLRRWLRLVAAAVVLPVASLGIAATSAPIYDDAVAMVEWDGRVLVGIDNAYHKETRVPEFWRATDDDGLTFYRLTDAEQRRFRSAEPDLPRARTEDCSEQQPVLCFRVVPGRLAVEESSDRGATWQLTWEVSEPDRQRLRRDYRDLGDVGTYLSSLVLLVRDQPDGGVVVLVANGRDGFARRQADGGWERIGFGTLVDNPRLSPTPSGSAPTP